MRLPFNLSLLDVLSEIALKSVEFLGVIYGDNKALIHTDDVELKPAGIVGESYFGGESVTIPYDSIDELIGVSVGIDVDEYGSASYSDFCDEIKFRRIKDSNPLKFDKIRIRR